MRHHTLVGFGFGPIQAGLFVFEAQRSGNFGRLVVAEVAREIVAALRAEGGFFRLDIAHPDHVESARVGPVELLNPNDPDDRERLIDAVAVATEVVTAVPSVTFYQSDGPGSLCRVLARGLERRASDATVLVYAAENHNRAAEILAAAVGGELAPDRRDSILGDVHFLNTVIGKMSGTVFDPEQIRAQRLETVTPQATQAFLVESFRRILVARPHVDRSRFAPGIAVFEEKDDLLPFEEAKLYGHNATHALAAYLAAFSGLVRIDDLRRVPGALGFLRAAFVEEAGAGLIRRHAGVDPLFTRDGFAAHVDDLLERMLNPCLGDLVARVARDPSRKLAWDDRLIGAQRLALAAGVEPKRFALGTAAALVYLDPTLRRSPEQGRQVLAEIWERDLPATERGTDAQRILDLTEAALQRLAPTSPPSPFWAL